MKQDISQRVETKQQQQKLTHDVYAHARKVSQGEEVCIRNFQQPGLSWVPGVISKATGPVSYAYHVMLESGQIVCRHQDHVRKRVAVSEQLTSPNLDVSTESNKDPSTENENENEIDTESENGSEPADTNNTEQPSRRCPSRMRQPPNQYEQNLNSIIM